LKGGESIKGSSDQDDELIEFGRMVAETLLIQTGEVRASVHAEAATRSTESRFGGGFRPAGRRAGTPSWLLALPAASGLSRGWDFRDGVVMTLLLRPVPDGRGRR
jgi:hypothetical protein